MEVNGCKLLRKQVFFNLSVPGVLFLVISSLVYMLGTIQKLQFRAQSKNLIYHLLALFLTV